MRRKLMLVAFTVAGLHFAAGVLTLGVGSAFAFVGFVGGPPEVGDLGRAIMRLHERVLAWPLNPLGTSGIHWNWWRGFGGLLLDSAAWGVLGGIGGGAAMGMRRWLAGQRARLDSSVNR
jgi:hypothetical protein